VRGSASPLVLWIGLVVGCDGGGDDPVVDTWQIVQEGVSGALLSVWGTSARDVWVVGADAGDGTGPTVLRFDGDAWQRVQTSQTQGDLWWVFGFAGGPVYMGGSGGVILRYEQSGGFTLMDTPGTGTVFGIWGAAPDDVWAVGGESESAGGFAWRLRDPGPAGAWQPEPSVPAEVAADAAIWKIHGTAADDAWAVGSNGVALHWDGAVFSPGDTGVGTSLFTVHSHEGRYAAVGGSASGFIVEHDGSGWSNVTPDDPLPMGLSGVTLGPGGLGVAVGLFGAVYVRDTGGWQLEELDDAATRQNLHGSWIDDEGGLWAAGGQTLAPPFDEGILMHRGTAVPTGGL
jgi:hypothetical protein